MTTANELLRQGRTEELWQMCCGFLRLSLEEFMDVQERLLLEQISLLNRCFLGKKLTNGTKPQTVNDFREAVPLTTYADYCPELSEKREAPLPMDPAFWVHTSGRSGDYPCKWIPITRPFARELSTVMYGIGMLASCKGWGDTSQLCGNPRTVYTVAPRPYMSGTMVDMIGLQTPIHLLPPMEESEALSFEDRIKIGFQQALSQGMDYFFGLSLVLVAVGNKFGESSHHSSRNLRPLLRQPRALFRLARGMVRSKLAGRPMLPRDLWKIKGIMSGGLDSAVYRDKIKHMWGRYPLDTYAGTEGGIIATQTWDYEGMTFIPSLNFLEFIPEEEHLRWRVDHSYQPGTVLLDEVQPGEVYEIVLTNFHGGALVRYRPGDMVRITSLRNNALGIDIPQMAFERRADDLLDFVFVRLTEKTVWQAIENTGIPYEDWTAFKKDGEPVLSIYLELKDGYQRSQEEIARAIREQVLRSDSHNRDTEALYRDDFATMIDFKVEVNVLQPGAFASFIAQRRAEGADLAHLKPPHINPSARVLSLLTSRLEEEMVAAGTGRQ